MNEQQFEKVLHQDWAYICRNTLYGPGAIQTIEHSLRSALEAYIAAGHITDYTVTHEFSHNISPVGYNIIVVALLHNFHFDGHQVTLAFNSIHPEMCTEYPPKTIDRWEAIITEIENEVPHDSQEYKSKDRSDTSNYKPNGDMPHIVSPER